ncbi:hypothetical protein RI367_008181, partial [Sorochytrium milnesiophthora]
MAKAQETFKKYADQRRAEHNVQVGDLVRLMRRQHQATRPSRKLDYVRLGPYKVKEQINT